MEHVGSEYIVILNDPELREGLVRDANRSRRLGHGAIGSHPFRRWFAPALHGLAYSVDPPSRATLRPAPANTGQ